MKGFIFWWLKRREEQRQKKKDMEKQRYLLELSLSAGCRGYDSSVEEEINRCLKPA
jgi:hypothetical protein